MKLESRRKSEWPVEVKTGSVIVKIYRSETRGRYLYTLVYRDTGGKRVKKSFADFETAKLEAQAVGAKIQNGQIDVLQLTSENRLDYQHAIGLLTPLDISLRHSITEYVDAIKLLGKSGSLSEAVRFFVRYHPVALPRHSVSQIYEEFLAAKTADNASKRYLEDIRSRLGRLRTHFSETQISEIAEGDLESWISSLGCGPVARNSTRALVITFFNFARLRGYLTRDRPTVAEAISEVKIPPSQIGIFQPTEMKQLLTESKETIQLYLAIGAFSGLRHAELMRLDWKEIKVAQDHIEVTAGKAKTAQRRIVPIQPILKSWIIPHARKEGVVFPGDPSRFLSRVTAVARHLNIVWPQNGLRHSYASYRLAICKSAAEVALEMGNSPSMVFRHYRELVTSEAAQAWWAIDRK